MIQSVRPSAKNKARRQVAIAGDGRQQLYTTEDSKGWRRRHLAGQHGQEITNPIKTLGSYRPAKFAASFDVGAGGSVASTDDARDAAARRRL